MRKVKAWIQRGHKEIISMMAMEMGVLMKDLVMEVMGARIFIKGQVITFLTIEETMEEVPTSGLTLKTDLVLTFLMMMGKVLNSISLKITPVEASKLTPGLEILITSLLYLQSARYVQEGVTQHLFAISEMIVVYLLEDSWFVKSLARRDILL